MILVGLAAALILVLIVVSFASKSVNNESLLGKFAHESVQTTCSKLTRDSVFSRSLSHQDENSLIALLHNTEALSLAKSAKHISDSYQIPGNDLLDLIDELQRENDILLQTLLRIT